MHICYAVKEKCWNLYDSYGEICVGCGCCSDDPLIRAKARLCVSERRLQEQLDFDDWHEPWREVQERNVKANIKYFRSRVRYYRRRVRELEEAHDG